MDMPMANHGKVDPARKNLCVPCAARSRRAAKTPMPITAIAYTATVAVSSGLISSMMRSLSLDRRAGQGN